MTIQNINDKAYNRYGKVISGYDCTDLIKENMKSPCPADAVVYVGSVPELEAVPVSAEFGRRFFGEMPIEVGYCNGFNKRLNGLEYHRNSEVNVACTDLIILIGPKQEITEDFKFDTAKVEAFFVPAGTAFQMYETTLHYAPCSTGKEPFRNIVILPKNTNYPLKTKKGTEGEDQLLFARNKWLLVHPDVKADGQFAGLVGENITLD